MDHSTAQSQAGAATAAPTKRRRRRWKRWALLLLVLLLAAGECIARFKYGLGDPPLLMSDPKIEYLYKPSMTYHRFGNTIRFNAWSMRSEDFPMRRSEPRELRVMVLGDSVINGGAWTDQSELATELLKARLAESLHRPVRVGNVSAGSWGPPNLLAYAERFGFFDADIVIIVLGSEDYGDAPTFQPLTAEQPTHAPICALQEAFQRYLPAYIDFVRRGASMSKPEAAPVPSQQAIDESMHALGRLIERARDSGATVALALHSERQELMGGRKPGYAIIQAAARKRGVPVIEFGQAFRRSINENHEPYRDWVHPNAQGQRLIADALYDWIMTNAAASGG